MPASRTGQTCRTCEHPRAEEIDRALRAGVGPTRAALTFWADEPAAIWRIRDHRRARHHLRAEPSTAPGFVPEAAMIGSAADASPEAPQAVRPVHVQAVLRVSASRTPSRTMRRALILPDMQVGFRRDVLTGEMHPFHDRRAMDVALQIGIRSGADEAVYLGDNLDLPDWSVKFLRSPEVMYTTQAAAIELAWWLALFGPGRYLAGNHEHRMEIALQANMAAGWGLRPVADLEGPPLMSIERLLGLDGLGIAYCGPYPHGEVWLGTDLRLVHGEEVRAGGGQTSAAVVARLAHSQGQGHIHRLELAQRTVHTRDGMRTYTAFSPGTLARIEPGVVPSSRHRSDWQQGVAVVDYDPAGEDFQINLVPIYHDHATYDGRRFEARPEADIVAGLEADSGYRFGLPAEAAA